MAKSTTQGGKSGKIVRYDVHYEADSDNGEIEDRYIPVSDGLLAHWEHSPGDVVATSGIIIRLLQETGVDALCGGGVIGTTDGSDATGGPTPGGQGISPVPVTGRLKFTVSGNLVNSATGVFSFYVLPVR